MAVKGQLYRRMRTLAAHWKNTWFPASGQFPPDRPARAEQVLPGQADPIERAMHAMQSELETVRTENRALRMRLDTLRPVLADILQKPDEALRLSAHCMVQAAEDGAGWEVVTEQCCLGGCDMGVYAFPAEREALLFAALLEAVGYQPTHRAACHSCYAEYVKNVFENLTDDLFVNEKKEAP